ncbi:hypothetical protein BC827DRAFT_494348 [Russula dissimulans]|nr:hypothetical protein BC827DRAFT_494348 [Russula dissimulans]
MWRRGAVSEKRHCVREEASYPSARYGGFRHAHTQNSCRTRNTRSTAVRFQHVYTSRVAHILVPQLDTVWWIPPCTHTKFVQDPEHPMHITALGYPWAPGPSFEQSHVTLA